MSRLQTSRISSGLRLNPMKLACIRPLAEQNAARRASDGPSSGKVLRQLALQELGGVFTFHTDHAQVRQGQRRSWRGRRDAEGIVEVLMGQLSWPARFPDDSQGLSAELKSAIRLLTGRCWPSAGALVAVAACGGCSSRCRWRPARRLDLVDRARRPRRARWPQPVAGCRRRRRSLELLYAWFRLSGQARGIKAGSYELEPGITPARLLYKLVRGEEALRARHPAWKAGTSARCARRSQQGRPQARHEGMSRERHHDAPRLAGRASRGALFPGHLHLCQGRQRRRSVLRRAARAMDKRLAAGLGAARPQSAAEDARRGADPGQHRREGNRARPRDRAPCRRRVHQPTAHRHAAADRPDRDLRPG